MNVLKTQPQERLTAALLPEIGIGAIHTPLRDISIKITGVSIELTAEIFNLAARYGAVVNVCPVSNPDA